MALKVLLVIIVCCYPLIAQTKSECLVESPLNATVRPRFFKNTATQTALISYQNQYAYIDDNTEIIGHCASKFKNIRTTNSQNTFFCKNGQLSMNDYNYGRYNLPSRTLECTSERVAGKCSIIPIANTAVRPKFFKKIGTRTVQLSPKLQSISINYDQEITARCDTKFKSPNQISPELNMICLNGRILFLGHPFSTTSASLECESFQWNLYESATPFPWCPSSMASYILARPWVNDDYEYLAGICYNLEDMSFGSLYYAAKHKSVKNVSPALLKTFKPLMTISDIDANFISKKTLIYDNPQIEKWIKFSNYKSESIVQNPKLRHDTFQQFDKLLNIDWWSGLKLGNWHFYEEALARHIESGAIEYDILAGISNAVTAPIRKDICQKNFTMAVVADNANNKLPLYIWNYLKSSRNYSDEVFVIGVNTPFFDFYDEKDIVFCNDICHEIDWLDNIRSTFGYRPMGVIFCCSVKEVIASERLDGFTVPKELLPPTSLPHLMHRFTEMDSTTEIENQLFTKPK